MRLLLVEDDDLLGAAIARGLEQEGFAVDWVRDGAGADHGLRLGEFDALVLDLGLPGERDGIEVLRDLRRDGSALPVLILTARDSIDDRVLGLDHGADDYLVKPFDIRELCARLRALVRRRGGTAAPLLRHDALCLDPARRSVSRDGVPVELSRREFAVLWALLENVGRVLSRERIEESLYGWNEPVDSNAVEVHVHHLRRKLGRDLIRTVRGVGYVIDAAGP